MYIRFLIILIINFLHLSLSVAIAHDHDQELIESSKCIVHFAKFEELYLIPGDTLHSIALKESGRKHSVHKIRFPWPWAVNVAGSGHYFPSKTQAINFVREQIIKGKENIDVGCMQINLKHHATAFQTLDEAFEPKINIAYAAKFLHSKYKQFNSWPRAIAHYHSATPDLGLKYKQDVIDIATKMPFYKASLNRYIYNLDLVENTSYTKNRNLNLAIAKINTKKPMHRIKSSLMIRVPKNNS